MEFGQARAADSGYEPCGGAIAPPGAASFGRCRRPQYLVLRGRARRRPGRRASAWLSLRHSLLCRCCADLAARGCRVIVPYLRGYGPTRFVDSKTPRSGEQAAIGADLIALVDALGIRRAVFAGYDWGGRAACVGAALWPGRCAGLVTVNGYLIQNIARAMIPATPMHEVAYWYQYYFQIERGRAGLAANRREIAKILWQQWSPNWHFDDATFDRTALGLRQSRLCRCRDSQLSPSLRPRRWRSALCRSGTPPGRAARD